MSLFDSPLFNTPLYIFPLESFLTLLDLHWPPWLGHNDTSQFNLTHLDLLRRTCLLFKDLGLQQPRKPENTEERNYNGQRQRRTFLVLLLQRENIFDQWLKYLIFLSWNSDTEWFEKPEFTNFMKCYQYRSRDIV